MSWLWALPGDSRYDEALVKKPGICKGLNRSSPIARP